MTLVYRAIWRDDRPDLGRSVHAQFTEWVRDRSQDRIDASTPGRFDARVGTSGAGSQIDVTVELLDGDAGDPRAVHLSYVNTTHRGERWHTLVRAWSDDAGAGWCWVDNSVTGDELTQPRSLDVISPLIARRLIDSAVAPRVGDTILSTTVNEYKGADGAEQLAELVSAFDRSIPIVVFARSDARFAEHGGRFPFEDIPTIAARDLAGIAVVAVIDEDGARALTDMWGREFGVFNGAFRVYARDVDPAVDATAYRHRYVTADRYLRDARLAGRLAGQIVGPESTLRRPPESFRAVKHDLDRARLGVDDYEQLYALQSEDLEAARREVIALRRENVALLEKQQETERLARHLDHAKKLLIVSRTYDDFDDDDAGHFHPTSPQTAAQAVDLARRFLSDRVEIHDNALVDAKTMDRAQSGADWAAIAWEGFRTLYAYGDYLAHNPNRSVDLDTWCRGRENVTQWPADRVARGESGTTKKQRQGTRNFPCSVKLSKHERIEMVAHLKVQKSGGGDIPRVYFLYSDRTKKVHVGFYGPHEQVPNTKTGQR